MHFTTRHDYGWAGTAAEFLATPLEPWLAALDEHLDGLMHCRAAPSQVDAWTECHRVVAGALRRCIDADAAALEWGVAFEYELPLEGGRRPDVVVLAGESVVVLEFKSHDVLLAADADQARAYARDLADYHKATHGRPFDAMVVLPNRSGWAFEFDDGTVATAGDGLADYLQKAATPGRIDLGQWLDSPYEPLPTVVAAAKRIFAHEPLPHVKAALSAGIPEALEYLVGLARDVEVAAGRALAFVTGVPGSGKTLLGLRSSTKEALPRAKRRSCPATVRWSRCSNTRYRARCSFATSTRRSSTTA
jgi:hypothetical protein